MPKKSKKNTPVDRVILVINGISAALLLLSYLAPVTDPRDFWIIAILGFGYHFLIALNVLFILYWIIRVRMYWLISLLCILAGFNLVMSDYGFNAKSVAGDPKPPGHIRVMAYNVHKFTGIERHEGASIQRQVRELIAGKSPDIVGIEEFTSITGEKALVADSLKKSGYAYHYFFPYNIRPADSTGNAIFSKYPIVGAGIVPSPAMLKTKAVFADIKIDGKIIRVYCIHLAAVEMAANKKGKILSGDVGLGVSSFVVTRLKLAFINRSYHIARIKRHMDDCKYPYVVMGDFNDTPISYAVNEIGDGLKNAFKEKGSGFVTTYYSDFPKLQIDYIMTTPHFEILSYDVIDKKLSDHKPVVCDIQLANP
ncbi:endonuclease/exonuclease/phosphatase family protein [Hufsiella ginkgonis]|uniref:Endonuclease/exonuclease/phosphatase domain-containing protein n=1 Tax=Hufsiella ginkgonis TaxID=2695274 RepID=A0A7K1Y298_9SPHI|nr:endonuclease/exonuclease/phosphatase family protein [Hufsiella ginkgonis]MXV17404.1 hypothetical protein [Hufsiella ginkgonis]